VSSYGPLIDRTHQAWKLHAANVGVALAIALHVVARWFVPGITGRELAVCSGASALIAAVSLFIFFGAVRCPACGAKWVWRAVRQRAGRWLEWLHEQQVCPVCGSMGDLLQPNNRWKGP
jgi:predicted RNA-binding Zn-ribbon protein involved in translation (DUF1610 family)